MTTRDTIKTICVQILSGEIPGNAQAAEIAYGHLMWLDTRDMLYGVKTSDADANAEIVKLIKESK